MGTADRIVTDTDEKAIATLANIAVMMKSSGYTTPDVGEITRQSKQMSTRSSSTHD
uniref:Uncharacterized protein n=1 Tax=Hyaloperonospora arabidopsidis (strain Emoy2) TaxID=559515 RepID=M4C2C0_HYAAE